MNQDFRTRYGEMRASDPTSSEQDRKDTAASENYPTHSNTRNIIFVQLDGRRFFLNYSYLVFCEEVEPGTSILMLFTTHTVKLQGLRLGDLLDELVCHTPRVIAATEARYNVVLRPDHAVINEIIVRPNE